MPILKHAKKKLLVDKKRTEQNKKVKTAVRKVIKKFRATPSEELLREVFSAVDTAAKKHVIHVGKADRIKSRLSKVIAKTEKVETKEVKKAVKSVKKTAKKAAK